MFKNKKGFTLIELLVVIAIIGVLASVVLASLNTARDKGNDAAVKANLANIRAQAELFYTDNNNSYGTEDVAGCDAGLFANGVIANAISAAVSASPDSAATCISSDGGAGTTATTWAVSISLADGTTDWCVDSTGAAEEATATGDATTAAVCG